MKERILNGIGIGLLAVCFIVAIGRLLWPTERGSTGQDVITIRIAHWQLEGGVREALNTIAREYETLHPDVRIQQIPIPERIYPNWLITQLIGGTAPDIIQIGMGVNEERIARFFSPITDLVEHPNPYNKGTELESVPMLNTFFDGMKGGYQENLLEYYAVPLSGTSIRVYYNLDLLKEITGSDRLPTSYREFIDLCKATVAFAQSNNRTIVPIAGSKYNGPLLMTALFESQTQKLMDKLSPTGTLLTDPTLTMEWLAEGKWSPHSPEVLSGLKLMRDVSEFVQPGFMQLQRDDATFYFVQGRSLMICSGSWDSTSIRSQAPFSVGVGRIPFPTPDDPEFGPFTKGFSSEAGALAGVSFGLTRSSENPAVARDFLLFLGSQPANRIWTNVSRWIPSVIGVTPHPDAAPFQPLTDGYAPGFPLPSQPDAARIYNTNINALFGPEGSPQKFADRLSAGYLEAQTSDLARLIRTTSMNSKRRDTVVAALAVQQAKEPEDAKLAEKLDEALQSIASIERGYYLNKAALRATENAAAKP